MIQLRTNSVCYVVVLQGNPVEYTIMNFAEMIRDAVGKIEEYAALVTARRLVKFCFTSFFAKTLTLNCFFMRRVSYTMLV